MSSQRTLYAHYHTLYTGYQTYSDNVANTANMYAQT